MSRGRIGVDIMNRFIYVRGGKARDMLLAEHYTLLKRDEKNNIYVFENKPDKHFDFIDIDYVLSDTLTF